MRQMEHSLCKGVARTQGHDMGAAVFEVEKDNYLKVNMGTKDGITGDILHQVWIKLGSMVGYQGNMKFKRESLGSHGFNNKVKKFVTGDGISLTSATSEGIATLFLADDANNVTVLYLQGESLCVEGHKVLAFAPTIKYTVTRTKSMAGIASAGFFTLKFSGTGYIAILTKGNALTFMVRPGNVPVFTDPDATVAWSGELTPESHTDMHLGRGSGESFQMKFGANKGTVSGFVMIQASEKNEKEDASPLVAVVNSVAKIAIA